MLLPEELALVMQLQDGPSGKVLPIAFTGNRVPGAEKVETIAHTPDGSYTDFTLSWETIEIRVQSVTDGDDLYIKISEKAETGSPGNKPGATLEDPGRQTADISANANSSAAGEPKSNSDLRSIAPNRLLVFNDFFYNKKVKYQLKRADNIFSRRNLKREACPEIDLNRGPI